MVVRLDLPNIYVYVINVSSALDIINQLNLMYLTIYLRCSLMLHYQHVLSFIHAHRYCPR